ncbi:uncharacterized protein N0V89_006772 [Didymosphaeria variabile]|uniref:FAD-binding PCMH-type domain-containing protein n=1 Tax=Didymosphaeria variabile TaxID=1932322 RepID=A0A9W9C9J5_9PLEO|nr:uncharacterized protein N0V89_006772 [Didymosphaeria variabile]KAJ4351430.1 hypothetical protein N0V89_006772 [Didymosphaeria variabile]
MDIRDNPSLEQIEMRDPVHLCCLALASKLGSDKLAYPDSSAYNGSLASYYSLQQETIRPACILFPRTVHEVSNAVQILSKNTAYGCCDFAIRSGGHTSWAGASNIAGGVTLDLRGLDSVDVKENGAMVQVGTGATWDAVYTKLDPLGRSVAGGRVAGVGVGGLTLGGGISHLSTLHGWTCDTVRNFQVVLSNGAIVDANADENADLFFALRGGGNNFGVVTRIDLNTYEQGPIWSGFSLSETTVLDANIKEFVRISTAKDYDQHASFMLSFAYVGPLGGSLLANTLTYTKGVENPPIYERILALPTLMSSSGIKNITAASDDLAALVPHGASTQYRTRTIISTEPVLHAIHAIWEESLLTSGKISGISGSISFEPIPPVMYERHAADNALGLADRDGAALLVVLLDIRWDNASDDELVLSTCKSVMDDVSGPRFIAPRFIPILTS